MKRGKRNATAIYPLSEGNVGIRFIRTNGISRGGMDIKINAIAYSNIAYALDTKDQWHKLLPESEANDLDLFKEYISEIIIKGDISDVTVGHFNDSEEANEWLEKIKSADDTLDTTGEFFEASKSISEELNEDLHQAANEGVLFNVQAVIEGEGDLEKNGPHQVATILKLDLEEEERLQLESDNTLSELDLDDIFPEPSELQKGLCYPIIKVPAFGLSGDVKFYQKDNVSGYFQNFLDCSHQPSSLNQAKRVFDAVSEIKLDRTGNEADGNDLDEFRRLKDETNEGVAKIDDILTVANDIVGSEVSKEDIAEKIGVDNPDNIAIDSTELPSKVKYTVDDEIDVTFPSTARERVEKEESEEGVEVTIRGTDVDTKTLDR